MALFLNGLPIITVELKNSLTGQRAPNAIRQYMQDRSPKGEPLLAFKRCLVHFAVGNEEAFMTTYLNGNQTRFFPFNKDSENPVNPNGHKTHYLWEDIWQTDTLLELIANYLHIQTMTERSYDPAVAAVVETETEAFIFPRYHQLDVVRHLLKLGPPGWGREELSCPAFGRLGQVQLHRLAGAPTGFLLPETD